MNICIIAKSLPVHITGGMEKHVMDLCEGLSERGNDITILTAPHPDGINKEERGKIKIHYLDEEPKFFRRGFYKSSAKKIRNLEDNFDIIHSQSTLGAGYPKHCERIKPFVVTSHGTVLNELRTLFNGKYPLKYFVGSFSWVYGYFFTDPLVYEKADRIISPSNELKLDISNQYEIDRKKIEVIPHGIDVEKYSLKSDFDDIMEKYGLKNDEKVILGVSRMAKSKGFHILLEAFSMVLENHDAKLCLVGTGGDLDYFKKKARDLGISGNVVFTGKIPDDELIKLYSLSDLFVHPTLWHSEVFGYVIAEAMACGTPVIASRIGGVPTVVDDGEVGYLFEPGNVSDLEDKIERILGDEQLASEMSEKSRERAVEKFSIDRMVEDTENVYEEVLENWEPEKRK